MLEEIRLDFWKKFEDFALKSNTGFDIPKPTSSHYQKLGVNSDEFDISG